MAPSDTSLRRAALVAAAYLGTFLATISISIVNVALPTLQTALQTDLAGLQWVVSAYAIALSAFMLSAGPLADRYGHKRMWVLSVLLFTLGAAVCAVAGSLSQLLWGRALQGLAGALLIPGAMPILTAAFPQPAVRARVIGGWSAFSALALVLGPLCGGLLVQYSSWPSIFWLQVPLGLVTLVLGLWGINEMRDPDQAALDPVGQLLSVVWLGALTYALIRFGHAGFGDGRVQLALAVAVIGCIAFVLVEQRVAKPLLPLDMITKPWLGLPNLASFVLGFSGYASLFFLSLFLQQGQGQSPSATGTQLLPQFLLMGGVSLAFGRLLARWSLAPLLAWGYAAMGAALALMVLLGSDTGYGWVALLLAVLGIGMGIAVPGTAVMVMGRVPVGRAGSASATMNALRQTGMTLGIALLGSLMGLHALARMEHSSSALGGSLELARAAVLAQQLPAEPALQAAYRTAMSQGFNVAMLVAGLSSLAVAWALWRRRSA